MEPRIEKITIEKIDRHSKPTRHNPYMKRYVVYLDNEETHTGITSLKPTVSEAKNILNNLLDKALLGSVNQRKVIR